MANVTYRVDITSGTNRELYDGSSVSGSIKRIGGSKPPPGSKVNRASCVVNHCNVYSSHWPSLDVGFYGGTGGLSQGNGSHSTEFYANDSILGVEGGTSVTVTVSLDRSTKAMNMRGGANIEISVDYTPGASESTSSQNKSTVDAGQEIILNISNSLADQVIHTVVWTFGSQKKTQTNIKVGADKFKVPLEWLNEIPNAESGSATVSVTTKVQGGGESTTRHAFTVTVPASVTPKIRGVSTLRIDNDVPSSWNIYVQKHSGITIQAVGAEGVYGSTISRYDFTGGASYSGSKFQYTVNKILDVGDVEFKITVTDSRGRTASSSATIHVYEYSSPDITSALAYRCLSSGEANEKGTYIGARGNYLISPCDGHNTAKMEVYYRKVNGDWGAKIPLQPDKDEVFGDGLISVSESYQVLFRVTDAFGPVDRVVGVSVALYTLFFKRGGLSIGVGMESTKNNAVEISGEWQIYHNGVNLTDRMNAMEDRIKKLEANFASVASVQALDETNGGTGQ